MSDEIIHLIIRITGDGVYATSPQAPGLAYGRPTLAELRADLDDVLSFHFDRPGPFLVLEHHERHYEIPDGELVIRIALDEHRDERQEVHTRIGRVLAIPEQAQYLLAGPPNAVGEVVYTCAVPADTISWLVDQLDPRGDALVAAVAIADQFVLTLPLSHGNHHPEMAGVSIGEHGHIPGTTVGQVVRATPVVAPLAAHNVLST